MQPTPAPAAPATTASLSPTDIRKMCADEIGATIEDLDNCLILARIGHLMPDLLSPEEKEELAALDAKASRHLQAIDDACAMPGSPVQAAKDLIEAGAVPEAADFKEFELSKERREERKRICKEAALSFYQQDVLPFMHEVCTRAASRLQTINKQRANFERANSGSSEEDARIFASASNAAWRPSGTLVALAKARAMLLEAQFQINLGQPSRLLRAFGLQDALG